MFIKTEVTQIVDVSARTDLRLFSGGGQSWFKTVTP